MKLLEVRRHAFTKKGDDRGKGSHLSPEGVRQARRIGETIGPFDRVLASTIPRTLETALALGFAVDDRQEVLGHIPLDVWEETGHHERWAWENPFARFAEIIARDGPTARLGRAQREAWTAALASVPDGGRVLIVSHGRVIESGLVTCVPNGDFGAWGPPFAHGEGVRLVFNGERFEQGEILRNLNAL